MSKSTLKEAGRPQPDSSIQGAPPSSGGEAPEDAIDPAEEKLVKEKRAEDRKETRAIDSTLPNE